MKFQGSGFLLGLVVGLLVGLSLALGVAIYVNKVPIPFVNKVPQRTADQDAAEAEKNRNWDPNSALRSKAAMPLSGEASAPAGAGTPAVGRPATAGVGTPPSPGATGVTTTPPAPGAAPPATAAATNRPLSDAPAVRGGPAAGTGAGARDPAAILGDAAASAVALAKPASAAAPRAGPDPFIYFVQAGAFGQSEDAEQVMPPKGDRLTEEQIKLLMQWIEDGAEWPEDAVPAQNFPSIRLRRTAVSPSGVAAEGEVISRGAGLSRKLHVR